MRVTGGWSLGVLVLKDVRAGKVVWLKFIRKKESLADYPEGFVWLEDHGFKIEGVVCDGPKGMFQILNRYRVQMRPFHQVKIVKKYLTRRPELPTSRTKHRRGYEEGVDRFFGLIAGIIQ